MVAVVRDIKPNNENEGGKYNFLYKNLKNGVDTDAFHKILINKAYVDDISKINNRRYFNERFIEIKSEIKKNHGERRKETTSPISAIFFFDLDGFKPINDVHGHVVGDMVLEKLGERFESATRKADVVESLTVSPSFEKAIDIENSKASLAVKKIKDVLIGNRNFVARYGGDEFVVYVEVSSEEDLEVLKRKFRDIIEKPFYVDGKTLYISASIGYTVINHEKSLEALLKECDKNMYSDKEQKYARLKRLYKKNSRNSFENIYIDIKFFCKKTLSGISSIR